MVGKTERTRFGLRGVLPYTGVNLQVLQLLNESSARQLEHEFREKEETMFDTFDVRSGRTEKTARRTVSQMAHFEGNPLCAPAQRSRDCKS